MVGSQKDKGGNHKTCWVQEHRPDEFSRDKVKNLNASSCFSYTSGEEFMLIKDTVGQGHHVNA